MREFVNDESLDKHEDALIMIFDCTEGIRYDIEEKGCFDLTWLDENNFIDINIG